MSHRNFILSCLFFLILNGCAHRGYEGLSQEVPELFPDFVVENYNKKETPKNIVYTEKKLPVIEQEKKEFYSEQYIKKKIKKSYDYYVPKNRIPLVKANHQVLENLPMIKTTQREQKKNFLIE